MRARIATLVIAALSFLQLGCNSSTSQSSAAQQGQRFISTCLIPMEGDEPLSFSVEKNIAVVSGVVCDGSPEAFNQMLLEHSDIEKLVLENIDGSADDDANLLLGRLIRKNNLTTSLREFSHIASGGTDLYLAGSKREWTKGAQIGVHSWSDGVKDGSDYSHDSPEHRQYLDYYNEMGIPEDFYWFTLSVASANDMHYLTFEELEKYNMVTEKHHLLDIFNVPEVLSKTYTAGLNFDRYTFVTAPNGKKIHIIAQNELANNQIVRARSVLNHYLEDYPNSEFGQDKSLVANKMADNGAILLLLNGSDDGQNPASDLGGQPLYQNEIQVEGGEWYINQNYDHRDATFEEILHMVHDYGIGVDQNDDFFGALPSYQSEIRSAQVSALTNHTWGRGAENQEWIDELTQENSLSQEYFAALIDSYYGLWGAWNGSSESNSDFDSQSGMWGIYSAKTRLEIEKEDPQGFALLGKFFHPYLTYNARIDKTFNGTFSLRYDTAKSYTNHSRYLKNVTLTGMNNSNVVVNELDNNIMGNAGNNMVIFSGEINDYIITKYGNDTYLVKDSNKRRDGDVTVHRVEYLKFKDDVKKL